MRKIEELFTTGNRTVQKKLYRSSRAESNRSTRFKYYKCCRGPHSVERYNKYKNHRRVTDPTKWHCQLCKIQDTIRPNTWFSWCRGFPSWELEPQYNPIKDVYVYLCEEPFKKFYTPKKWFGMSGEVNHEALW